MQPHFTFDYRDQIGKGAAGIDADDDAWLAAARRLPARSHQQGAARLGKPQAEACGH
jgi:hypothetical protein